MNKFDFMEQELLRLKENSLYRSELKFTKAQQSHTELNGRDMLMLSSNSYLDMCHDPEVVEYVKATADKYGTGSGGSRLTTGTFDINKTLEKAIADFKGEEDAIVFNTGYMANVGVISSVCNREWTVFSDELNHASIIDGCRLSKAKIVIYRHNDMKSLEEKLAEEQAEKAMIVSDGVFSMDGDVVNLPKLVELADKYNALSMIDEAHSTGVVGKTGRGTAEYYGMKKGADITVGTLSKSVGSEGGFVCGSRVLIEYLKNKARSYIFSTAMAPTTAAASLKALEIISRDSSKTERLQRNVGYFCDKLKSLGVEAVSQSAIIPIIIGSESKAMKIAETLREQGFFISAIRYPTVARGQARLRASLMSSHTEEELSAAASAIADAIRKYN